MYLYYISVKQGRDINVIFELFPNVFCSDLNSLLDIWSMVNFLTIEQDLLRLRQLNGARWISATWHISAAQLKDDKSKQLTADRSISSHYRKDVRKNWKNAIFLYFWPTDFVYLFLQSNQHDTNRIDLFFTLYGQDLNLITLNCQPVTICVKIILI